MAAAVPSSSSTKQRQRNSEKELRLHMLTWNVGGSQPPPDLEDALGLCDLPAPDMYGIGLQEMNSGSSESKEWVDTLTCLLADYEYVRIKYRQQIGVLTLVFVRRSLLPYCTSFESEATKTGMGGWWGNKGGVSVRMDVCGMNLIIVNCHLAAHQDNVQERIVDFDSILDDQKFKDPDVENILDHDYVFWMGDLNFRLDDVTRMEAMQAISDKNYSKLLASDQLNMCREEKLIFEDFQEGEVTFPPTYKFDVGTDTYDTRLVEKLIFEDFQEGEVTFPPMYKFDVSTDTYDTRGGASLSVAVTGAFALSIVRQQH